LVCDGERPAPGCAAAFAACRNAGDHTCDDAGAIDGFAG